MLQRGFCGAKSVARLLHNAVFVIHVSHVVTIKEKLLMETLKALMAKQYVTFTINTRVILVLVAFYGFYKFGHYQYMRGASDAFDYIVSTSKSSPKQQSL
jgi:hypothetical protein